MKAIRATALLFILMALVVVATCIVMAASAVDGHRAYAAPPLATQPELPLLIPGGSTISGTLTTDAIWGPGFITITGDILINPGVVIIIRAGTIVQVASKDSVNLGIDPDRIEYMVLGRLEVDGPVTFTSQGGASTGGAWYGLCFLSNSTGRLARAAIEHGVIGVTIQDASPTLTNNTIRYLRGSQGSKGTAGLSGNPGMAGGEGMDGGLAHGISITGNSAPLIEHNTIHSLIGGTGGQGGNGGRGSGSAGTGAGGGDGGDGGKGGEAVGIFVGHDARPQVQHNTITAIFGGDGGPGGRGGSGEVGSDGQEPGGPGNPGGNGGQGGAGGAGGGALGIYVQGSYASPSVTGNSTSDLHAGRGGDGGDGGEGGPGGQGSSGNDSNQATGSTPGTGGRGGLGRKGGDGGQGGLGGVAAGIAVTGTAIAPPVQRNTISAIYAGKGGDGGSGSRGGRGGDGGNGGSDLADPPTAPGGSGGHGGDAGSGGHGGRGGNGGKATGLFSSDAAHDAINNLVHDVTPGNGGLGGEGAGGGRGGDGGDAGLPWIVGTNWGGRGGSGGDGGNAGHGGDGGHSAGWHASAASVEYLHNTSADIADGGAAGSAGSSVGSGGSAGRPGQGPGDPPPPAPVPGRPGETGGAGTAGNSMGLWAAEGAAVIAINNILAHLPPPGPNTYGIRIDKAGATLRHNNVWQHQIQYSGVVGPPSDLQQDPGFVDWYKDIFFLHRGSPCLDEGMEVGVTEDYDGQSRPLGHSPDIGFDEVAPTIEAKFVDLDRATPGAELVYTLIITNPDLHAPAMQGILNDPLPASTSYVGGLQCTRPACTYRPAGRRVVWTGDLPVQTAVLIRYTVLVDRNVPEGTVITNSAFYSAQATSHWSNVVSTTIEPVFTLTKRIDLLPAAGSEEPHLRQSWPIVGAPLPYTIVVTNAHPSRAATGVIVTDAVPAGGHWIAGGSHRDGIVTLTLPTIPPRAQASASWVLTSCQTSLTNEWYRVVTSTMQVDSDWGPPLTTILSAPLLLPSFAQSSYAPLEGAAVTFSDTSSSNGSPIRAWSWDFGDGEWDAGTPVTHTYAAAGNYTVTLTVTDTCGYSETERQANAVVVYAPVCTEVTGVDLTVVTTDDIEVGSFVEFSADISPDDAAKLYRFRLTVDGRLGFVLASSQDPLTFSQRFDTQDRHTVKVTVWNCGQTEAQAPTALAEVMVPSPLYLHLPVVVKGHGN